ncbi:MAG: HlyD family secretion protein [Halioglobus sp.]|nr:HlyD family secretion protein [Halioglobus sp.]
MPDQHPKEGRQKHPMLIIGGSIAAIAILLLAAYLYWEYDFGHPSTEDAYVGAHAVLITPQVDGQVIAVAVQNNQHVNVGDLLFQIDPRPFEAAVTKARNELLLTAQTLEVQRANIAAAQAKVEEHEASVSLAEDEYTRTAKLAAQGNISQIQAIQRRDELLEERALLNDYRARLEVALRELGNEEVQQARLDQAVQNLNLAELGLAWTTVSAPSAGYVTQFDMRVGEVVTSGTALFPLIEDQNWWVDANFKEAKLANITPGQPAEVTLDMYPDQRFTGTVESVSSASASSFSLLPPQNTTGNWVKVSQRIPVRVRLEPPPTASPFRMGASATVTINTEAKP